MEMPDRFLGSLPDDDVVREVVGHGAVRRSPSGETETQIRVHWAATRRDGRFGEKCRIVSRWVGCGKLLTVPVGSRWLRRVQVKAPFTPLSTSSVVCVGIETIGRSIPGLDLDHYPFDRDPEVCCFRLQLDGNPGTIALLPVMEVIRAVFGCRSGFLRQLFDGHRDPNLMRRRFLFDRTKSKLEGRTVEIHGHSRPTEREAWLAAMMTASAVFRASHDGVFSGIQVAGGLGGGAKRFVKTSFPFPEDEPVGLAYESRLVEMAPGSQTSFAPDGVASQVRRSTTTRRVITRILAFESVSPFDVVTYSWPRFGTRAGLPARNGRTLFTSRRSIVLVDSIAPGTLRATMRLGVEGANALAATGVIFISKPRLVQQKGPSKSLVDDGKGTIRGSTADAQSQGDDDVVPVEMEAKDATGNPGAAMGERGLSFIATDVALHRLVADRGWCAEGLAEEPGLKPPLWPIAAGKTVHHIMEVEVSTSLGPVLVYEAGSKKEDKRALGFVARTGMGSFTEADLEQVRRQVVLWGAHWLGGRQLPGFVVRGLSRQQDWWQDTALYASKIGEAIDALIARAQVP